MVQIRLADPRTYQSGICPCEALDRKRPQGSHLGLLMRCIHHCGGKSGSLSAMVLPHCWHVKRSLLHTCAKISSMYAPLTSIIYLLIYSILFNIHWAGVWWSPSRVGSGLSWVTGVVRLPPSEPGVRLLPHRALRSSRVSFPVRQDTLVELVMAFDTENERFPPYPQH